MSGDEPSMDMLAPLHITCFPRVSGDEPTKMLDARRTELFSPRERG